MQVKDNIFALNLILDMILNMILIMILILHMIMILILILNMYNDHQQMPEEEAFTVLVRIMQEYRF